MIQSRPLDYVFDFEVGQLVAGQFRVNRGDVLLLFEGMHALVNKWFPVDGGGNYMPDHSKCHS